eukprot:scaffold1781_cov416-Prasinococcus_capsulatus_cf.AAC.19
MTPAEGYCDASAHPKLGAWSTLTLPMRCRVLKAGGPREHRGEAKAWPCGLAPALSAAGSGRVTSCDFREGSYPYPGSPPSARRATVAHERAFAAAPWASRRKRALRVCGP